MGESPPLVLFRLDTQRYAFALGAVERIVQAVEVTALPRAPEIVLGAIDVGGRVLPVLDLRTRLGLPARALRTSDQFLIAHTARRDVVLVIDEALDVVDLPATGMVGASEIAPGLGQLQGVVQLADGLVFIHDLEAFLSLDEARVLDAALSGEAGDGK